MGQRTNGGVLGVSNMPTTSKAGGVWTLKEVALYKKAGLWPGAATFSLAVDNSTVNKGSNFTITLTTTGVSDGTLVPYTITGIASGDLSAGSLTGNITVTSNTGTATFTTASSGGTSGNLTAAFACGGQTLNVTFQEGEPYFKYVTALLHGDGTNGTQNNTFVDSSSNNFTVTRNGNTTQGSFTPYGATWSAFFASETQAYFGAQSYFEFATGSNTLECWFYPTVAGVGYNLLIANPYGVSDSTKWGWSVTSSGTIQLYGGTGSASITSTLTVNWNQWNHIVMVTDISSGNTNATVKFYINGTGQTLTGQNLSGLVFCGQNICFSDRGSDPYSTSYDNYMSNFRWVRSASVYSGSTISVPTTPLTAIANTKILTLQSNRFADNSGNNLTIYPDGAAKVVRFSPFNPSAYSTSTVGGSGYFDGSGDYLVSQIGSIGTGDFTVEGWLYIIAASGTSSEGGYLQTSTSSGGLSTSDYGVTSLVMARNNTYNQYFFGVGSTTIYRNTVGTLHGQWVHFAAVRSSGTVRLYFNGVLDSTPTTATANITGTYLAIGGYYNTNYLMNGYWSNLRITNVAVYSGNFTPPTAPVTTSGSASAASYPSTTNVNTSFSSSATLFLGNFTNAGIYDSAMMNDLETVGNAQISTTQKKFGTASMYFDGTGDYLKGSALSAGLIGSGDFTIECWVYISSLPGAEQSVCSTCESGGTGIIFGLAGGGNVNKMQIAIGNLSVGNPTVVDTVNFTTGAWVHVAAVRYNGTIYLYKNGTSVGTPTSATGQLDRPTVVVGGWPNGGANFNGYIDDLRITKGYARYTTNFTPPTGAFPG